MGELSTLPAGSETSLVPQYVLDAMLSHVAVIDATGTIVAVNAAWRTFAECNAAFNAEPHARTGLGTNYLAICQASVGASSEEAAHVAAGIHAVLRGERSSYELDYPCPAPGVPRWFRLRVTPLRTVALHGCLIEHVDITEAAMSKAMIVAQGRILEAVATHRPLPEILEQIVDLVEAQLPDAPCSILRVDPTTNRLRSAAGRHLPPEYSKAVDGVPIGPNQGSCGTAAYRKQPVEVLDIATDPLWVNYRDLALQFGLRSCLSIPVLASDDAGKSTGEVLATFAIYHRRPISERVPVRALLDRLDPIGLIAAHLVRVAIERDRAEAALRASEARLRAILDHSPALIFVKDLTGRLVLVNRYLAELQGSATPWEGKTFSELLGPSAADAFAAGHQRVITTREVDQREEEVVVADRRRLRLLSVQFPLFDDAGELSAVCGIATDVTSRVRAEAERDRLWTHSPDPVCIASLDATFIDVNAEWTRRFGWSNRELRGKSVDALVHPDDAVATTEAFASLRRGEPLRSFEHRFRSRDGQYRWLSWNALPLVGANQLYGFVRDVTDERKLQDQLRQSQKLEAIGQLAGGVAHDFNNLLTIIQGNVDIMSPLVAPDAPDAELLHEISEASRRAAALTRQLLTFSRKAIVEPRTIVLDESIGVASRMLRRLIGEDIQLQLDLAANVSVRIDPGQLEQVLMNLVLNARDAMPRGGRLRISTSTAALEKSSQVGMLAPGFYAVVSVADGGVGIDPSIIGRVFEPFFTTKGVGRGTGLGLATVYGIVRQAEGQVTVESEPERGAEFRVYLPVVVATARETPVVQLAPARGDETILLVEDEPGVRRMASRVLANQGYKVLTAINGADALRVSANHTDKIDLLVTDVVMPELGGGALVEAMRRQRPDLRVLYVSGYTDDAVVRHGIETSRDPFLLKPFSSQVLTHKVRELLDSMPRPASVPGRP